MESTGVFWRPIYTVLEDQFELILANAHEIKALPGRKTDVRDGEWIAERYAAWLDPTQFHSRSTNTSAAGSDALSQKSGVAAHPGNQSVATSVLETATIKLTSVVSDVWGKSGQSMINAIIQGESDALTRSRMSARKPTRETPAIASSFGRSDPTPSPDAAAADREPMCGFWSPPCEPVLTEIEAQMEPSQEAVELLMTHPGVQAVAAMGFVSEVGIDLSRFPSAKHAGFLGWCVSRQSYQRRQTQAGENHQGQELSARVTRRDCLGDEPHQKQLPIGSLSPLSSPHWPAPKRWWRSPTPWP